MRPGPRRARRPPPRTPIRPRTHPITHRYKEPQDMADSSFDIVSKVDRQEVDNALNQAAKEISQRYDFKDVGASIAWSGESGVEIKANSEERAKAVLDVFQEKLIKRGISLKSLDSGDPKASGKEFRLSSSVKQGISQDDAKKIAKIIRDEG